MILFKQFYWLSCSHLTFRKIWYCLIKTRIDLVSLSFSNEIYKKNLFHFLKCNKTITVFCIGQYEFLWTLEINIHLSLKASVNIVFKVHKNSHWPQQKTIIVYYYIMILFKQFYWLSCCHLTFRKIWYCLIKTCIDLFSLSFSNEIYKKNLFHFLKCNKTITVFCIGQYEFLWTLKASVNIVFKVHINSYWPQQKTIIVYYYLTVN
jgi:hypothetical protein